MIEKVLDWILQYHMIEPGDGVVAGVSGGADSVCLLLVLSALQKRLDFRLLAVHVEHGLRGEESLADARFTEQLCRTHIIDFKQFQVDAAKEAGRKGQTIEEAARKLRYDCFLQACREYGAHKIAVAHHRGDQAETVLLHLFRGTGLKGLGGIQPVRQLGNHTPEETRIKVIRPLLQLSRKEIEQWLETTGVSWRTDTSNLKTDYVRNKLRLQVLPFVEQEIAPGAGDHIAQAAQRVQQVQAYLSKQARAAYEACTEILEESFQIRICLATFRQQEPLMQTMVLQQALEHMAQAQQDLGAVHLEALQSLAKKESGKEIWLPYGIRARREYETLVLEKKRGEEQTRKEEGICIRLRELPAEYSYGGCIWRFTLEEAKKVAGIPEKTYTKWFDYDKIEQSLRIRSREPGDYLEINETHGRKKVKDYLIDCKIPRDQREALMLLADGQHVLWIVGMRISEAYKVTKESRRLLKVEVFGGITND